MRRFLLVIEKSGAHNRATPPKPLVPDDLREPWERQRDIIEAAKPFARCQRLSYVGRLYNDKPCGECQGCILAKALGVKA